jgi:preprotein translocase subunit SecG
MSTLITFLHVFVCVFLIISILLQSSKGGGLAGVLGGGGGGMGSVFGGRGAASFLAKMTMYFGIAFAITALSIALLSKGSTSGAKSMVQQVMEKEDTSSPAAILPTVPGEGDNLIGGESPADNPGESK